MTKLRLRNLMLPVALAVIAAVLVGIYIVSYRDSVTEGAGLVEVLVASRDIPANTQGTEVASGGYLKTEMVPRRAVVSGSVVSGAALTSKVVTDPIYKGEQITLRHFAPASRAGSSRSSPARSGQSPSSASRSSCSRARSPAGDRVDVVATAHYTGDQTPRRATTRSCCGTCSCSRRPKRPPAEQFANKEQMSAMLVMTDSQAQTMGWAMRMSNWFLALRPTRAPRNSRRASRHCTRSSPAVCRGARRHDAIVGGSRRGVDEP